MRTVVTGGAGFIAATWWTVCSRTATRSVSSTTSPPVGGQPRPPRARSRGFPWSAWRWPSPGRLAIGWPAPTGLSIWPRWPTSSRPWRRPLDYHRQRSGTVALLEEARAAGVGASCTPPRRPATDPRRVPDAGTAPARPQYPYALTKYLGEQCVLPGGTCTDAGGLAPALQTSTGRGPAPPHLRRVLRSVPRPEAQRAPFTVVGDGTRCATSPSSPTVADAFVAAAQSPVVGEVFNVGTGAPVPVTVSSTAGR